MPIDSGSRIAKPAARTQPIRKGTGFTNIQRVLQRPTRLAEAVTGKVGQEITGAQADVEQARSEFQKDLQDAAIGGTQDISERERLINEAKMGAEQISDEEVSQFERLQSGIYSGPMGLRDESELARRSGEAQRLGQNVRSQQGREALLERFVSPQSMYTQGQRKVDLLALGGADARLRQLARQSAGLAAQTEQAGSSAAEQAEIERKRAAAFGAETKGLIKKEQTGIEGDVETQFEHLQKQVDDEKELQKRIRSGTASVEDIQALGLDPNMLSYGANLADFLGTNDPTLSQAISQEQYAGLGGLARLAGIDPNSVLGKYDPKQIGTFKARSEREGGIEGFKAAVARGKENYEKDVAAANKAWRVKYGPGMGSPEKDIEYLKNRIAREPDFKVNIPAYLLPPGTSPKFNTDPRELLAIMETDLAKINNELKRKYGLNTSIGGIAQSVQRRVRR